MHLILQRALLKLIYSVAIFKQVTTNLFKCKWKEKQSSRAGQGKAYLHHWKPFFLTVATEVCNLAKIN